MLGTDIPATGPLASAAQSISTVWARDTWTTRLRLWRGLSDHSRRLNIAVHHPLAATAYLQSLPVSIQTQHQYGKQIHALLRRMGHPTAGLSLFLSSLVKRGATIPQRQAPPITRQQLRLFASSLPPRERAAVLLCWKTASRWGDIVALTRAHLVFVSPTRIIVSWKTLPKGAQRQPFRADSYTVIEGEWTEEIAAVVATLPRSQNLTTMTTAQLAAQFAKRGLPYTAHSIKRGAITQLLQAVSRGELTFEAVMRVAKHLSPETTIRYGADLEATALALGTHLATRRL